MIQDKTLLKKELRLDLDEMSEKGYFYTEYDIGGEGHAVTIKREDKDAFLDAFAAECRSLAERLLVEWDRDE